MTGNRPGPQPGQTLGPSQLGDKGSIMKNYATFKKNEVDVGRCPDFAKKKKKKKQIVKQHTEHHPK